MNLVTAYTKIDKISFVCYETSPQNPIWGQFRRWEQFEPYNGEVTYLEILYASHLDESWKRFVVCKELCHALESTDGSHTVEDRDVTKLINSLAIKSVQPSEMTEAFGAEILAEMCAMEMLLPIEFRQNIIDRYGASAETNAMIAKEHKLPLLFTALAMDPSYIAMMSGIFEAYE